MEQTCEQKQVDCRTTKEGEEMIEWWWLLLIIPISTFFGFLVCALLSTGKTADVVLENCELKNKLNELTTRLEAYENNEVNN